VVPLHHRQDRRRAGGGVAHGLYRRAGLRDLVSSGPGGDGVGRGVGGRSAAWA
jgi:hypothetical protein